MARIYQYRGGAGSTPSSPALYSAAALHASVGINIHVGYDDGAYADYPRLLAKLQELGITYVRDGLGKILPAAKVAGWQLLRAGGIHVLQTIGRPVGTGYNTYGTGESAALVRALKLSPGTGSTPATTSDGYTGLAGLYDAFQGPNEWSNEGSSWVSELTAWTDEYWAAIKGDPALSGVPFFGPSLTYAESTFHQYTSTKSDALCAHPYRGGRIPELASGQAANLPDVVTAARSVSSTQPIMATETGYTNAVGSTGHVGVPEDVSAHYIVREALFNYARGVTRSYFYQLLDERPSNPGKTDAEAWFGLFAVEGDIAADKSTWTLRRKPSGDALARLMPAIRDTGTLPLPTRLPYRIESGPGNLFAYPLARRGSAFQLALVMGNALWDTSAKTAIADSSATVAVSFAGPVTVTSLRPSVSGTTTTLGTGVTTLNVPVDGKLTLLTIS